MLALPLLTACGVPVIESEIPENIRQEGGVPALFDDEKEVSFDDIIQTTGQIDYFVTQAPDIFAQSALNQLCLTPAQSENTNKGVMFCFVNAADVLNAFEFETVDDCPQYSGEATVEIAYLTEDATVMQGDSCYQAGSCEFNRARFVSVVEIMSEFECKD